MKEKIKQISAELIKAGKPSTVQAQELYSLVFSNYSEAVVCNKVLISQAPPTTLKQYKRQSHK